MNVVKIDITVQKNWKDKNNNYTTRPEDLTVTLWRNGEKVNDATPTEWAKNGAVWTCTFEDLPAADGKGELYTYTVKETDPDVYKRQSGYCREETHYVCRECGGCPYREKCLSGRNWKKPLEKRYKKLIVSRLFEELREEE